MTDLPLANVSSDAPAVPPQLVYAVAFQLALQTQMRQTWCHECRWQAVADRVTYTRLDISDGTACARVEWPGDFEGSDIELGLGTLCLSVLPSSPLPTVTPVPGVGIVVRAEQVLIFIAQAPNTDPSNPSVIAAFVSTVAR